MKKKTNYKRNALRSLWGFAAVVGIATAVTVTAPAPVEPLRITLSPGGSIVKFYEDYTAVRLDKRKVVIDGLCMSACTMVTGLIPADRVCVTPYAILGFHSAYTMGPAGREFSPEGSRILWEIYPESVRALLKRNGWTSWSVDQEDMLYIQGEQLSAVYPACKKDA